MAAAAPIANLASVYTALGDYARARPLFEQALAMREATLGSDHPETLFARVNVALILRHVGEAAQGRTLLEQVLATREKTLAPDHPELAQTVHDLGFDHWYAGEYAAALRLFRRAAALRGEGSADLLYIGEVLLATGATAEAKATLERALAQVEAAHGPDHFDTSWHLDALGAALAAEGRTSEARALHERSLAIRERALGPDAPGLFPSLRGLAVVAAAEGRSTDAIVFAERALARPERAPPRQVADLRFVLARLLWESPARDAGRAVELARQARETYRVTESVERQLAEVERWLATRKPSAGRSGM